MNSEDKSMNGDDAEQDQNPVQKQLADYRKRMMERNAKKQISEDSKESPLINTNTNYSLPHSSLRSGVDDKNGGIEI